MNLKSWIIRHPIFTYILLTVVWSFGIWSLMFLYIDPGGLMNAQPFLFLFVVLGGFGPSLSGIFTTWLIYEREGLQALWERFRNWRVGRWWLAVLIIPTVTALTPLLRWIAGYPVDFAAMINLLGPGLGLGLTAGLMEEFGWRGFLLPHLLKRYSPLAATLLLGLIWGGLWHGYADYFALGGRGMASWILIILLGPVLLTAWSFIITWVYEHTQGSMLMAFFMHASISSSALIFGQTYQTTAEEIAWTSNQCRACHTCGGFHLVRDSPRRGKMNLLAHLVVYNLATSIFLYATLAYNPRMWLHRMPPEVLAKVTGKTPEEKHTFIYFALPFLFWLFGYPIFYILQQEANFMANFLTLCAFFAGFAAWDTLVLDLLIFCKLTPHFIIIPGTVREDYSNMIYHLRSGAKGVLMSFAFSLALSAVMILVS
jgi:uncharacterized protein